MTITILTLFPEFFTQIFSTSILKHAQEKNLVTISVVDIRTFATDKHQTVDDKPYGGGVGMVMKVDVVARAIQSVKKGGNEKVIYLDPRGKTYNQTIAKEYKDLDHLILLCGHYEGIDERIYDYIDESISIGDFILTGGELPAALIADSVIRLLPGVLPEGATSSETFEDNLLEFPQYTRPEEFEGKTVPEVLLSGNHAEIAKWRAEKQLEFTKNLRPDLLTK